MGVFRNLLREPFDFIKADDLRELVGISTKDIVRVFRGNSQHPWTQRTIDDLDV